MLDPFIGRGVSFIAVYIVLWYRVSSAAARMQLLGPELVRCHSPERSCQLAEEALDLLPGMIQRTTQVSPS